MKLETYFEEMEEMDQKCEELENENSSLKKEYEQIKSIELVGSHMTEISDLEFQKSELEAKLRKEVDKRETVENELFKIEEEYEQFKIEVEERDAKLEAEISKVNMNLFEGRKVSNTSVNENIFSSNTDTGVALPDEAVKFLIRKKQKTIDNFEKENESLQERLKSFEHVSVFIYPLTKLIVRCAIVALFILPSRHTTSKRRRMDIETTSKP